MDVTIEDLRLFNACPLLHAQKEFYHRSERRSRIVFSELESVFNNVFYQVMRGRRIHNNRIASYWEEAVGRVLKEDPTTNQKDLEFAAQCLAVFMDIYQEETRSPKDPSFEIKGPGVPFTIPVSQSVVVTDRFPLVTSGRYGSIITIFQFLPRTLPEARYLNDPFLSIYAHAYRSEFGKNEFSIRIRNLGDGGKIELTKGPDVMSEHLGILKNLGDLMVNNCSVPSFSYCQHCPISSSCHARMLSGRS